VVANDGVIKGGKVGVELLTGGIVGNGAGASISGSSFGVRVQGGGTVIDAGTISSSVGTAVALTTGYANQLVLYPGAVLIGAVNGGNAPGNTAVSVLQLSSGASVGSLSGIGGTISGFNHLLVQDRASWVISAENLAAGSQVTDLGTLASSGGIFTTVTVGSNAVLDNLLPGTVSSSAYGVLGISDSPTILNDGMIIASQAVLLRQGGFIENTGTISGGAFGIDVNGGEGTVVNAGSIGGAQVSVLLPSGYTDRLIVYPGAQFSGLVVGGNTAASAAVSTMELGGTTVGTISGLGSTFTGFQVTQIDAGASWDAAGQNSIASGNTLANQGTLVIDGGLALDGALMNSGLIQVGQNGDGQLLIEDGASVVSTADAGLAIGVDPGHSGAVTVSGAGSVLNSAGSFTVGGQGVGSLSVLDGAMVTVGSDLTVGAIAGGSGTVEVEAASTLFVGGNLDIGSGELTVGAGAAVVLGGGGLNQGSLSVVNLQAAIGARYFLGGTLDVLSSQTQDLPGYVDGAAIYLRSGVSYVLNTQSVVGDSVLGVGADGSSLTLNAAGVGSDVVIRFADGTGSLELGPDLSDGFQGTISGFVPGDTIIVDTPMAASFVALGPTQVAVMANSATLGVIGFSSAIQASAALETAGGLVDNVVACFAAGTRIRTRRGQVAIEALREGDDVWSVLHQAFRPVVWIGRRVVDCERHPAPWKVWPVRIAAGAFGPGQPVRDLFVSPDHALYVDEVLVPARRLVNGETIRQVEVDTVSYYHIELRRHDVLLAEGLAAESYLDTGDRSSFANSGVVVTQHPSWGDIWELEGCAPLVVRGPRLQAIRARLAA
jgi:T5SS/PEP-CTERM-associated repeat protein